jgi:hypothetical protein
MLVDDIRLSGQNLLPSTLVFLLLVEFFLDRIRSGHSRREIAQMRYSQQMQAVRKPIGLPWRCVFATFVLCVLFAASGLLWAQTGGTGALSGAITDATGAMVVGAQVRVTNAVTGDTRTVQTNDHGLYVASLLSPGQYSVEVTKQGFKMVASPNVQVIVAETRVLNIRLETGVVTQTITVASSTEQLQTQSSELGRVTDSRMIQNLPLVTRNYTQIIGLNPGVAQEANNAAILGRGNGTLAALPGGGSIMSQGATSVDNNFEMNGLSVNDMQSSMFYSAGIPIPNPDTIQEFKVQTTQYDATTGRDAGADVDLITRSGTNSFHGSAFEYFRNEALNGTDWFAKLSGQPRQVLRQNQFQNIGSGSLDGAGGCGFCVGGIAAGTLESGLASIVGIVCTHRYAGNRRRWLLQPGGFQRRPSVGIEGDDGSGRTSSVARAPPWWQAQ